MKALDEGTGDGRWLGKKTSKLKSICSKKKMSLARMGNDKITKKKIIFRCFVALSREMSIGRSRSEI